MKSKNGALDGMRGLAILLVYNVHSLAGPNQQNFYLDNPVLIEALKTIQAGHIGVDLFFILSGYFIYITIHKNQYTFFSFIRKRYSRLLPLVIFVLIVFLPKTIPTVTPTVLFDSITLLNVFGDTATINYVQWTLVYEVYFYILIGIMLIVAPKLFDKSRVILLVALSLLLMNEYISRIDTSRFISFFYGVLIAKASMKDGLIMKLIPINSILFPVSIISSIVVMQYLWSTGKGYVASNGDVYFMIISLLFSMLIIGVINKNVFLNKIFAFYPLRILGAVSFSFYMIHAIIALQYSGHVTGFIFTHILLLETSSFTFVVANYISGFVLSFIISLFLFYYIERPYFVKHKHPSITHPKL